MLFFVPFRPFVSLPWRFMAVHGARGNPEQLHTEMRLTRL
jgi:hypothetical protein